MVRLLMSPGVEGRAAVPLPCNLIRPRFLLPVTSRPRNHNAPYAYIHTAAMTKQNGHAFRQHGSRTSGSAPSPASPLNRHPPCPSPHVSSRHQVQHERDHLVVTPQGCSVQAAVLHDDMVRQGFATGACG